MPQFVRDEFEKLFSDKFGFKETVAVNSGTSALIATIASLDLKPGDEVITTPFTFIATTNAILLAGGKPVFVDIKPDSKLIDENKIERALTPRTKAIVVVHLYGRICNMPVICEIAKQHDLVVVEDCAQSLGARCSFDCATPQKCRPCKAVEAPYAGTMGDAACFSFYKTKNLSTFEGGAIGLNGSSRLDAVRLRAICDQGQVGRYNHQYIGYNFRLAEPLCLLAIEGLKLHEAAFLAELGRRDESFGHYPYVVYEQPAYKNLGIKGDCPIAEEVAREIRKSSES